MFEKLYVEVEIFKNMLISKATGTEISHQEYKDRRGVPSGKCGFTTLRKFQY